MFLFCVFYFVCTKLFHRNQKNDYKLTRKFKIEVVLKNGINMSYEIDLKRFCNIGKKYTSIQNDKIIDDIYDAIGVHIVEMIYYCMLSATGQDIEKIHDEEIKASRPSIFQKILNMFIFRKRNKQRNKTEKKEKMIKIINAILSDSKNLELLIKDKMTFKNNKRSTI